MALGSFKFNQAVLDDLVANSYRTSGMTLLGNQAEVDALQSRVRDEAIQLAPEGVWRDHNRAPDEQGNQYLPLKQSIDAEFDPSTGIFTVYSWAPHAKAIEEGADAHPIRPRLKNALRSQDGNPRPLVDDTGEFAVRRRVMHPGNKARPFLQPALDKYFK